MYKSISETSSKRTIIAFLAAAAALSLAGCGLGSPAVATTNSGISGSLYGGRQPIVGSTVTVWAAGTGGYGSAATSLATTTSAGPDGAFNIPAGAYACPTINTPLYITAVGGNPGNSTGNANPDVVLAAPLGLCSVAEENSFVDIDEVTTVATAFALSGFINPANFGTSANVGTSDGVGTTYSATPTYAANNNNLVGLTNAMNLVSTLVKVSAGTAPGTVANATVDVAKLNTMADILVSCVNSDPTAGSTACSTLFNAVSPASSTAAPTATNTFEAAYYLAKNPTSMAGATSNLGTVYQLATPTPPYMPTLTAQPTDWTVGVNYSATGLTAGQRLAIDPIGNVWVTSTNSTAGQLTEFGPTGSVLTTFTGPYNGTTLTAPMGVAIDNKAIQNLSSNGGSNVAVADSGTNSIFVFNEGTSDGNPAFSQIVAGSATAGEEPYAVGFGTDLGMYITETTTTQIGVAQTPILIKSAYGSATAVSTYGAVGVDHTGLVGPFGIVNSHDNTVFVVGQSQSGAGSTGPATPDRKRRRDPQLRRCHGDRHEQCVLGNGKGQLPGRCRVRFRRQSLVRQCSVCRQRRDHLWSRAWQPRHAEPDQQLPERCGCNHGVPGRSQHDPDRHSVGCGRFE